MKKYKIEYIKLPDGYMYTVYEYRWFRVWEQKSILDNKVTLDNHGNPHIQSLHFSRDFSKIELFINSKAYHEKYQSPKRWRFYTVIVFEFNTIEEFKLEFSEEFI